MSRGLQLQLVSQRGRGQQHAVFRRVIDRSGPAKLFFGQLRAIAHGDVTSRVIRVIPTADGFVLEHEETQSGPPAETARRVWICTVDGERISEVTCYCNGGWDDELRARHAAEAPMLRW